MHKFITFIDSLSTSNNVDIINSIIEAYNSIYEGIGDVKYITTSNNLFLYIIKSINKCNAREDFVNNFFITFSPTSIILIHNELPKIIFGFNIGNSYDSLNNQITIDITNRYDEYIKYLDKNLFNELSNIIKEYSSEFIHEYRHYIDSKNNGNRHKFPKDYILQRSEKIKETLARIKVFLDDSEKLNFYNDLNYFNNQTEKNARISAYIWEFIEYTIHTKSNISFDDFINSFKKSYFYAYLTTNSKKRVYKRLYYIWDALTQALPELRNLDNITIDEVEKLINNTNNIHKTENISKLLEAKSEYVISKLFNHAHICDTTYKHLVESQVDNNWLFLINK